MSSPDAFSYKQFLCHGVLAASHKLDFHPEDIHSSLYEPNYFDI